MYDMFDDPQWVHEFVRFLADDHHACLDMLEQGGYLTLNNGCEWIGTGGLGYTSAAAAARLFTLRRPFARHLGRARDAGPGRHLRGDVRGVLLPLS